MGRGSAGIPVDTQANHLGRRTMTIRWWKFLGVFGLGTLLCVALLVLGDWRGGRFAQARAQCRDELTRLYDVYITEVRGGRQVSGESSSSILETLLANASCSKNRNGYVALKLADLEILELIEKAESSRTFLIAMDAFGNHIWTEGSESINLLLSDGTVLETTRSTNEADDLRTSLENGEIVDIFGQSVFGPEIRAAR